MATTNYINGTCVSGIVVCETEKAILFKFEDRYGIEDDKYVAEYEKWIPKSIITLLFKHGNMQMIKLPAWFVRKNADINACAFTQESAKKLLLITKKENSKEFSFSLSHERLSPHMRA